MSLDLDWPYQKRENTIFYAYSKHIVHGSFWNISNKLIVTGVVLWKILWKSLFEIICQTHSSCKHFQKYQANWQWQLNYEKYSSNYFLLYVWQAFTEHCLKMLMSLNWSYQNWQKTFHWRYFIAHEKWIPGIVSKI